MTEFTWNVKYLKEDDRGYASTLFCEMKGISEQGITKIANTVFCFGGDDYKPKLQWTQEQIDQWAERVRPSLEERINTELNN